MDPAAHAVVIDWMFSVNLDCEQRHKTHRNGVLIQQKGSTRADAEQNTHKFAVHIQVNATNFGGTSFSPGVRVWAAGLEQTQRMEYEQQNSRSVNHSRS